MNRSKYIGSINFYKRALLIALPIMLQNGIANVVAAVDNIMVGQLGTPQMAGVSIVNQLMFVFNICIFGAISGAGIFTAQYHGSGDNEGVRNTFRFKLFICALLSIIAVLIFHFFGDVLISTYLTDSDSPEETAAAMNYGKRYLSVLIYSVAPFAMIQAYSGTLRETGKTVMPMICCVSSVFINTALNYVFIFGKLGFRAYGVEGAAFATVIARCSELVLIVCITHLKNKRYPFIVGAYRTLLVPKALLLQIIAKGSPLLVNETLWAGGMAILTQKYSVRGMNVVSALNISNTIANVFNICFIAMGSAIAIIVGQHLGANEFEKAKSSAIKLIFFSTASCVFIGLLLAATSSFFPMIYKTEPEIRSLASDFIVIAACAMPIGAFCNAAYFTLRSGGKTFITFLFDSVYLWVIAIPVAHILVYYTELDIRPIYFTCLMIDLIKCVIGYILLKKGIWLQNIVSAKDEAKA